MMCKKDPCLGTDCPDDAEERRSDASATETFSALADPYRLQVLQYFYFESTDVATLDELCSHLANEVSHLPDDPDSITVELRHKHIPKLSAVGIVEFDTRSSTIRYRCDPLLERCLEFVAERNQE